MTYRCASSTTTRWCSCRTKSPEIRCPPPEKTPRKTFPAAPEPIGSNGTPPRSISTVRRKRSSAQPSPELTLAASAQSSSAVEIGVASPSARTRKTNAAEASRSSSARAMESVFFTVRTSRDLFETIIPQKADPFNGKRRAEKSPGAGFFPAGRTRVMHMMHMMHVILFIFRKMIL